MPKLSEYVDLAAAEYFRETGKIELDAHWTAEFFQDSGAMDEYPRQNLIAFFNLVQKALVVESERAARAAEGQVEKAPRRRRA